MRLEVGFFIIIIIFSVKWVGKEKPKHSDIQNKRVSDWRE